MVGVDQSAGMLAQAAAKGLAERTEQVGLQDLTFEQEFDAAMVVDAMENVSPEDWPRVARNLARALKPGGHLFLTLEEVADEAELEETHRRLTASGQPAVRGEVIEGDVAGYHYYPGRTQALEWLTDAGLSPVAEEYDDHGDWGYRLFLLATLTSADRDDPHRRRVAAGGDDGGRVEELVVAERARPRVRPAHGVQNRADAVDHAADGQ